MGGQPHQRLPSLHSTLARLTSQVTCLTSQVTKLVSALHHYAHPCHHKTSGTATVTNPTTAAALSTSVLNTITMGTCM